MKRFIFTQFAFGAVIIGAIAWMMYVIHGVAGAALYLVFAGVYLIPAILKAKEILKSRINSK